MAKNSRGLEAELQAEYFASLRGKQLRVLVESPLESRADRYVGTSCRYATVELPAKAAQLGEFVDVIAGPTLDGRIQAIV